jgi:hypothetical protein
LYIVSNQEDHPNGQCEDDENDQQQFQETLHDGNVGHHNETVSIHIKGSP